MAKMETVDDLPFSKAKQLGYTPKKRPKAKAGETKKTQRGRTKRQESAAYKRTKGRAFIRDGMVCRCGCGSRAVNTHHIKKRSGGRDDSLENLITMDWKTCHPLADAGTLWLHPLDADRGANGPVQITDARDGRVWVSHPKNEVRPE